MTSEHFERVSALVLAALEYPPADRESFLQTECGGNADLLNEVHSLLAMEHAETPLGLTAEMEQIAGADVEYSTPLPNRIGRYEIIDLIGEGGMGVVFRAKQEDPKRDVAVKLIRPG